MRLSKLGMTPDLWWMTLSMGLWGLGFGLYGILWPLYVEHLGGSAVVVGLLSTTAGFATAFVVFPGGWLADRVDRRKILIWGAAVAVPVPFMFAWAPHWQWLLPGVLLYFGSAFSTPAMQAIIMTEASSDHLFTAYNVVMSVFGAGMVIGPTIGGYLATHYSYSLVFVISGSLYAVSTLAILPIKSHPPVKSQEDKSKKFSWTPGRRPRLFQWMLFSAGLAMVQGLAWPFVVPYWKSVGHLSMQTIGYLGSAGILFGTISGPVWGKLGQRWGIPRSLGYGMGLVTMGFMALIWAPSSVGWGLCAGILRGAGEGSRGLAGVAVGRTIRRQEAGTAYGLFNFVTELAGAVAPLPGGLLYGHWPYAPLVVAAFFTGIIAWWLVNGLPGRPRPAPPLST